MKTILLLVFACCSMKGIAQKDSILPSLQISGYLETYYSYDFNKPINHTRPGFLYSFNRHNEVNLNLGLVKAGWQKENLRVNLALMAGTYANANLAAEPGVLKNIFEANAGVKVSRKNNVWIDAGIFASHIGFESAIGKDCWNLSRSILAENSPYYESGVKISYTSPEGKWMVSGMLLNGWQRIQRVDGNNTPAFGHQLTYKPTGKITLNSSSFVGSDKPDSARRMRYFHNVYGIFQLNNTLSITAGLDVGLEQKSKGSNQFNNWYAPILLVKLVAGKKSSLAARVEYYNDRNGVIISTASSNGFRTWGYSVNYDYLVSDNVSWRTECRAFTSKDRIFEKNNELSARNFALSTSLAVSF